MNKAEKIIGAGCFLLISIHLIASYFPQDRLWGVNLLHFFPGIWRWILVISCLLILTPYLNKVIGEFLSRLIHLIGNKFKKINKRYQYTFLSLIGGVCFWVFRVKTFFLGDSYLRAKELNLGKKLCITEPLDFYLHVQVAKLFSWDALQTYAFISVISGVVFLFFLLLRGDLLGNASKEKSFIFSIILTLGSIQLFFGYAESYTIVFMAMALYLLFSLGYLKNKNRLFLPILFFLLALSLHLFALTFLPSLLYLIFAERAKKTGTETEIKTEVKKDRLIKYLKSLGIVILMGIGLFLLLKYNPEKKGLSYYLIYPLGKGESTYSIFSFSHILDLINHQLLISPVGLLILLTSVLVFAKKINYRDSVIRFLLLLSIFSLAFAFFVDPKLGYPRDWDMFTFSALGYTFLGVYVFLKSWREANMGSLRYVAISLLFTSLISTAPWIYVNASEEKSVERFEHLLDLDKERIGSGRENLAMYYDSRREWDKEIQQWEKGIAVTGNVRYITNLGVIYYNQQKYDLASKELERSLKADSTFASTHFYLGKIYAQTVKYEKAITEYRKAIKFSPEVTEYYDNLGALLAHLERYQEAIQVFKEGLKATPKYPSIYRNLGYTYVNLGDLVSAEKYLNLYLEYSPQAKDVLEVRQVLRDLSQKRFQVPKP